jgi:AIPR protein
LGILQDIRDRVDGIAAQRGLVDNRAFGLWFLEDIEEFSQEEAESLVTDGAWDGGRDAVYHDEERREVRIYQFKWSESEAYVDGAFNDIQRAANFEIERIRNVDVVRFYVVTIATATEALERRAANAQRTLRGWVTRNDLGAASSVEFYDLRKFAQLFEKIYGIEVVLDFMQPPIQSGGALVGLANARGLVPHADREELLAFNIRAYLGKRKGSVNAEIAESLAEEETRNSFWMLNNGIVCLTTQAVSTSATQLAFTNFTIVNGAQTTSTIAKHYENNAADEEPVWVVAKIVTVEETEIDRARLLTKTSNTQTPASNKDLRAVDISHRRIAKWMQDRFGITYAYRRGVRVAQGSVQMKDVAQAFVAYELGSPHIPFARVGTIFSDTDLYNRVFDPELVEVIRQAGTEDDERDYIASRLVPVRIAQSVRAHIDERIKSGDDPKWRSATYHLVWVYRRMLALADDPSPQAILANLPAAVDSSVPDVYRAFKQASTYGGLDIPRDLKTTKTVDLLVARKFVEEDDLVSEARAAMLAAWQ